MNFVILSAPRSGTTALCSALGSHPDILMHWEIFHPDSKTHIHSDVIDEIDISKKSTDPRAFIDQIFSTNHGKRCVGFKTWLVQSKFAVDYAISSKEIKVIVLERTNRLALYSSLELAKQTSVWHNPKPNQNIESKIHFNEEDFINTQKYYNDMFDYYKTKLKTSNNDFLYITYKEHILEKKWGVILDFLGLQRQELRCEMIKLYSNSIVDRFAKEDASNITAYLTSIHHPEWATEDIETQQPDAPTTFNTLNSNTLTLESHTAYLDTLPKIFVNEKDVKLLSALPLGRSLLVLQVESPSDTLAIRFADQLYPLRPTPEHPLLLHQVLGAVSLSPETVPLMERARDILRAVAGQEDCPLFTPPTDGSNPVEAFLAWLFDAYQGRAVAGARRTAALHREAALLRRHYDELQDSFQEVEKFFHTLFVQPMIAFTNPPGGGVLAVPRHVQPGGWITQELPLPSRGLAGLALHVGEDAPRGSGRLGVQLYAHETSEVLETWQVPYESLTPGWVPLLLHRALAGRPEQSLQLRITWQPDAGASPSLSLGALHPDPQACVQVVGSQAQPRRGLALRLITAMPGQPVPAMPGAVTPTPVPAGQDMVLPKWVFEHAQEVSARVEGLGWELVTLVPNDMTLQIHPLEDHTTVVRLPLACPAGVSAVTMQAKTSAAEGPVVEYALAVLPPQQPFEPYFAGDAAAAPGFSGWQDAPPLVPLNVAVELDRPAQAPMHIYMATRLAPGQTSQHAWARVLGLVFSTAGPMRGRGGRP